jgi:hypothetical protein
MLINEFLFAKLSASVLICEEKLEGRAGFSVCKGWQRWEKIDVSCMNLVLLVTARLPVSFEGDVGCKTGEFCKKIAVDDRLVARSMDLSNKGVLLQSKRVELFANCLWEFT